jgi:ferric-dicitrate binding protein FerR (iron transport regulator)
MTQEEKMKRLLDTQDHPETFTEEELQAMLKEDDLRESAELMARLKQTYIGKETEDIDVDAEWQRFASQKPKRRSWGWMQIAAAFIGLLMLSGITYAAIHIVSSSRSQQAEVQASRNQGDRSLDSDGKAVDQGPVPLIPEPKTFENVPLKDITAELASFYHIATEVRNAETAALRLYYPWNPQMPLGQVVEELNRFEKVHLTLTNDTLIIE